MKKLLAGYFAVPLVYRVGIAFLLGIGAGLFVAWGGGVYGEAFTARVTGIVSPFGTVLIAMLKMVVIPIIFFSLVSGAASLPLRKFGRLGITVLLWYFLTSVFATAFGTALAVFMNPQMGEAGKLSQSLLPQVEQMQFSRDAGGSAVSQFIDGLFMNPFQSLAEGKFLPIIVFAILFGLAARTVQDELTEQNSPLADGVRRMLELFQAALQASFRLIDWIMEYFPIGVLALTTVNFGLYGASLFGPYLRIALCVITGVVLMTLVIYPVLILLFCRENPFPLLNKIKEPIITAFLTRSSAATLPVSLRTAQEKLHVRNELSGFALPLGATINMDGVCIHLPVFTILAANIFGVELTVSQLVLLMVSVVFASVGAGGIPGGSIFLLFMVLANLGLNDGQIATVVALAIGINPLMDMFETAGNVAGDNICNYIVARRNGMIDSPAAVSSCEAVEPKAPVK